LVIVVDSISFQLPITKLPISAWHWHWHWFSVGGLLVQDLGLGLSVFLVGGDCGLAWFGGFLCVLLLRSLVGGLGWWTREGAGACLRFFFCFIVIAVIGGTVGIGVVVSTWNTNKLTLIKVVQYE
jgi:hypothetical protein